VARTAVEKVGMNAPVAIRFPLALILAAVAEARNYEVYPGSAFYMGQFLDRGAWEFVATHANGMYHHPVGFQELDAAGEAIYAGHFTNRFAMVEGDMGSGSTTGDLPNLQAIKSYGLTPVAAFVNRPSSNRAVWRQLVRNNAGEGAPTYEMLAPHRLDDSPLGWNDPARDYARDNMLYPGCIGGGVDAPVHLFVNEGPAYRQSIYDMRDWSVANGRRFNYLVSPNNSYGPDLLADTIATVRALEDGGHEPDVYGVVLYGLRPVDLTPEKVTIAGTDHPATTITGLAYYLLKHRDGEAGTLDLAVVSGGISSAAGITSPTLAAAAQSIALPAAAASRVLTLTNSSPWLDYAGVLRARLTGAVADWEIGFEHAGEDLSGEILSPGGRVFLGSERWLPGTTRQVTMTSSPKVASPGAIRVIVEALPHAGVDHALDVLEFVSGSPGNSPPTLALDPTYRITREALPYGPLWFTVGDAETDSRALVVSVSSSDPLLVPAENIELGQSGIQRWLRVTPAAGRWGVTTLSVTVQDGSAATTVSFPLEVVRSTVLPVVKADNALAATEAGAWTGGVVPGPADQAVWDATVTAARGIAIPSRWEVAGLRLTQPGGDVTLTGPGPLALGVAGIDLGASLRNLTVETNLVLDEFGVWNIGAGRRVEVRAGVGGSGGITKTGTGTLELGGSDSFAGPLTVQAGELIKQGAGNQMSTTVAANAVLKVSHPGGFGAGNLAISASNNQSGRVELAGGISVLAGRTLTLNARNSTTDAIVATAGANTAAGAISLGTGGGFYGLAAEGGSLALTGNLSSAATGTRTLTLRGAGEGSVSGAISNGSAGALGLVKDGSGRWTLAGTLGFTGPVEVKAGTLRLTSPLPTQPLTVQAAATLSGSATVAGATTIRGTHSPGDGIGTQRTDGPLTYEDGSRLLIEIGSNGAAADAIDADTVIVAPSARLAVAADAPGGQVDFASAFWQQPRSWVLLGATSMTGHFAGVDLSRDSLGQPAGPFGTFSLTQGETGVTLHWQPGDAYARWSYANFGESWDQPSTADPDGDGRSNADEWLAATDQLAAGSFFTATIDTGEIVIARQPGRLYRVESATDLAGPWLDFAAVPAGSGEWRMPLSPAGPRRFFRVVVALAD
jgi:autotransporter-associated beta strand protein